MNIETVPANARLLRYFDSRARQYHYPKTTEPNGTHPDLVMRLWDELGQLLPEDCHAGIIFAFAGGTHTYAFRLPPDDRAAAITAGATRLYHYRAFPGLKVEASTFDLAIVGDEWVFGGWLKGEDDWIRSAYEFATIL